MALFHVVFRRACAALSLFSGALLEQPRTHHSLPGTRMFLCYLPVVLCLFHYLKDIYASSSCKDLPVFTPSRLVVKYGDPATATCSICKGSCDYDLRLEEPFSATTKRGKDLIWNVTRFNQWSANPVCFIFNTDCTLELDVTVYQPQENISVSIGGHSGPLREGQLYSLQCNVKDVAPAQNMTVAFYRDSTELQVQSSNSTLETPVSESFTLDYNVTRWDHGAQFWCEARLELGPDGPQPPPVVRSLNITANVQYAPHRDLYSPLLNISVTQGQPVQLNCSTEGNPSPHYNWTIPSASHIQFSGSVFTVDSASSEHEGLYTCKATNQLGSLSVTFSVKVHEKPYQVGTIDEPPVSVTPNNTVNKNSAVDFTIHSFSYCITILVSAYYLLYIFH